MPEPNYLDLDSWSRCCLALGWHGESVSSCHEALIAAYEEPQRAYHTSQHLRECLALLHERTQAPVVEIEMALWFHDAVYDPKASDNEERSANWACEALRNGGVEDCVITQIQSLILATKHHTPANDSEALLIDIDLSILGQKGPRFEEYETQIRQEYHFVPTEVYSEKRAEILLSFLKKTRIYSTPAFQARFEIPARDNLTQLVTRLSPNYRQM